MTGGPISQEVYTDHISEGCQDVYLLRVKKKNDSPEDGTKRNLEVELRTPKPPTSNPACERASVCADGSDKCLGKKGKKRGKGGKGGKGKKECKDRCCR